ncbi:MAG: D-glycero-beta-D-manno-heptose 1-phosphate adenylyltransferase [Bacteroidota bacterium]
MYQTQDKVFALEDLMARSTGWGVHGGKVVFTNGCFDLLHIGHIDYLEKARKLGARLIVGLNDDDSVRRLKGNARPIIPQEERARMLAALEFVDGVVLFSEDTPIELIKALRPDILVKGGDYQIEEIVGYEEVMSWGGTVSTLPLVEGYSSTTLLEKLKPSSTQA